jgi:microcystin-dependent protein
MAEPFLAEIRMMSFNFAPKGWALANGQLLPINQNQALFSLLGTTFGGNGQTTFALPDLRSRTPISFGNGHTLGERAGTENVTLTLQEMPAHTHLVSANNGTSSNVTTPTNNFFSNSAPPNIYTNGPAAATLPTNTVSQAGGSQAHNNLQPFLTINFSIALQGIFPSQN